MAFPRRGSICLLMTGLGAFLLILSSWRIAGGSFSHGSNNDPAYMYLFNGLLLLGGEAPFHVHHPGTPRCWNSST